MIMQVHDELVFEVRGSATWTTLAAAVTGRMCGAAELRVPLSVETGGGRQLGRGALVGKAFAWAVGAAASRDWKADRTTCV